MGSVVNTLGISQLLLSSAVGRPVLWTYCRRVNMELFVTDQILVGWLTVPITLKVNGGSGGTGLLASWTSAMFKTPSTSYSLFSPLCLLRCTD
jgi:hypothetical protein